MSTLALVMLGGALGSVARHLVREAAGRAGRPELGTLVVNVAGAAALGGVVAAGWSPAVDALVATGGLGALTTMSTLALDAVTLAERPTGGPGAAAYVALSLALGLAAALTVTI